MNLAEIVFGLKDSTTVFGRYSFEVVLLYKEHNKEE